MIQLYHVDSSVVLADMFEEEGTEVISKLWQLSDYKHKFAVVFTSLVMGEIVKVLKEGTAERMKVGFDYLYHLLDWYSINIYTPPQRVFALVRELQEVDSRLMSMDAFILASAICHSATRFITLDNDFTQSELRSYVRKTYNLTIQKPGDLLWSA